MAGFVLNQYNFIYLFIFITKLFISFMTTTPLLFVVVVVVVVVVTLKYHFLLLLLLLLLLIKDRNTMKSHFLHFFYIKISFLIKEGIFFLNNNKY